MGPEVGKTYLLFEQITTFKIKCFHIIFIFTIHKFIRNEIIPVLPVV